MQSLWLRSKFGARSLYFRNLTSRLLTTQATMAKENLVVPPHFKATSIQINETELPRIEGTNLMTALHKEQISRRDTTGRIQGLFAKRSPERLYAGDVIRVESFLTLSKPELKTMINGVIIGIERKGVHTMVRLRCEVMKTGVEMKIPVFSPLISNIEVLQRQSTPPRRSKFYYLRKEDKKDLDEKMLAKLVRRYEKKK